MLPVQEQLAELRRGTAEILLESDLEKKLGGRPAAAHQGRIRPHGARPAPRAHGADQQDGAVPAPRPRRDFPDRRLHRADRRPDRPQRDAPALTPEDVRANAADLRGADLQDPRSEAHAHRFQLALDGDDGRGGHDPAGRAPHGRAHARARRLLQALPRPGSRSRSTSSSIRWCRATTPLRCSRTWNSVAPTRSSTCWSGDSCRSPMASSRRSS